VASGMVVTFAGISLVALEQLALWREPARRKGTARRQEQRSHQYPVDSSSFHR
jgi:hypothetical protein